MTFWTQSSPHIGERTRRWVSDGYNGIGTAGFVLALIGLILCWIPILDWILWLLGVIFSFIGVFRAPRGLAIAGLVISFIGIIILITFIGAIAAML